MTEIKRIEGIIEQQKRFNQERNYITIESKQKQIDRIKSSLVVPEKALKSVRFSFKTNLRAGDDVLSVRSLSKSFGEKKLFKDFDLEIKRGEKVFLIGPNGCGKSTFLKIINREESSDDGFFSLGTNVRIGYFDQNIEKLRSDKTVINEVWDDYRLMDQTEIRNALARFLFRGDDVFKKVSSLSGGEKSKISLLKIMLSKPNFLILDEPTNHLDIASREVLEDALLDYDGTLLVVSHDRYFINKLASRIVYLNHDGAVLIDGNYDKYLEIKEQLNRPDAPVVEAKEKTLNSYQLEKLNKSLERKRRADIKKTEEMISAYEEEISTVQAELSSDEIQSDYDRLLELTEALTQKQEKLDSLYAEWEKLQTEE